MPSELSEFLGWQDPPAPQDLDRCKDWKERLVCLADYHKSRWAAFGPYLSKKAAQNTGSNVEQHRKKLYPKWRLDKRVVHTDDGWVLYLRMTR